jgi:hypothetical protein
MGCVTYLRLRKRRPRVAHGIDDGSSSFNERRDVAPLRPPNPAQRGLVMARLIAKCVSLTFGAS